MGSRLNLATGNGSSASLAHRTSHDSARDPRQLHAALQRATSHASAASSAVHRSHRSNSQDAAGLPHAYHAHPAHLTRTSSLSTHHRDDSHASLSRSLKAADPRVPKRSHAPYAPAGASPPLPPLPPKQEEAAPASTPAFVAAEPVKPSRPPQNPNRRASLSTSVGPRPKVSSPEPFQASDMGGLGLGLSHSSLDLDVRGLTPPPSPPVAPVLSAAVPGPSRTARPVRAGRYSSPRQSSGSIGSHGSRRSSASSHRKSGVQFDVGTRGGEGEGAGIPSLVIVGRDTPPASPVTRGSKSRSASEGSVALSQTLTRSRSSLSVGGSLPPGAGAGAAPPSVLDSVGLTVNSAEMDRPEGLSSKSRDRVSILRKRASGVPPGPRPSSLLVPASKASKRHTINGAPPGDFELRPRSNGNSNAANRNSVHKPLPNVGVSAPLQQAIQNAPLAGVAYVLRPTVTMSTQTPDWTDPVSVLSWDESSSQQGYSAYAGANGVPPPPPAHSPPAINSISPSIYSVASFNPSGRPDRRASRGSFWASEEIAAYGHPEGYHNAPVPPLPTMDELPLLPPMPDEPEVLEADRPGLSRRRSSVAARMIEKTTREKMMARGSFYDPNGASSSSDLPLAKADSAPSPKLMGLGVPGAFEGFHSYAIPRAPELKEAKEEKENFNVPYLNPDGSHHGVQSPSGGNNTFQPSPATTPNMFIAPEFGTSNPFAPGQRSTSPAPPMLVAPRSTHPSRSRSSPNLRPHSPALSSAGSWTTAASVRAPSPNPPAPVTVIVVTADTTTAAFARRKSVAAPESPKTPQNSAPAPTVFLRKASLVAIPSAASKRTSMYAAVTAAASSLNDMIANAVPPEGLNLPAMPALGDIGAAIRKSASSSGLAASLTGGGGASAVAATPVGLMPAIVLPEGRRSVSDSVVPEIKRRQSDGGLREPQLRVGGRSKEERMSKGRSFFLVQALESQGGGGAKEGKEGKAKGKVEAEESSAGEETESDDEIEVGVVRRVEVRA